jgi:hypothetical protein
VKTFPPKVESIVAKETQSLLPRSAKKALDEMKLEFVFLQRLERRGAAAQGIVFCDTVEDVNAAIV